MCASLPATDRQVPREAGAVDEIGEDERSARAEIEVRVGCVDGVERREEVGDGQAAGGRDFRNALPKSPWLGNPLPVSVVSNVPFPSRR